MPRSLTFSLIVAVLGLGLYFFWTAGNGVPKTQSEIIAVALNFFNISAILCLFYILARRERASAEEFGQVMRDNISTIVVALFINLIMTFYDTLVKFSILGT